MYNFDPFGVFVNKRQVIESDAICMFAIVKVEKKKIEI